MTFLFSVNMQDLMQGLFEATQRLVISGSRFLAIHLCAWSSTTWVLRSWRLFAPTVEIRIKGRCGSSGDPRSGDAARPRGTALAGSSPTRKQSLTCSSRFSSSADAVGRGQSHLDQACARKNHAARYASALDRIEGGPSIFALSATAAASATGCHYTQLSGDLVEAFGGCKDVRRAHSALGCAARMSRDCPRVS